jgi:hypothetical protein
MLKLIVPRNLTKLQTKTALRRYFDERFPTDEKIEEMYVVNGSCYLKVGIPKPEFSKQGRLQYHTDEFGMRFEIIPGMGEIVMEG